MTDTEDLHDLFKEEEGFNRLIEGMDHTESIHQLRAALGVVGREVQGELGLDDLSAIDPILLGWMWICWEAHHPAKRIEGQSLADHQEQKQL